jgi:integrase
VEKLRDKLRDEQYAHRTINRILWIVSAVFRLAIKRGQYFKNPVDSVERAVQAARELKADDVTFGTGTDAVDPDSVSNPKEIQTLLQEAKPGFERTLFETAYLTGAREGELLALRWTDLELPKESSRKMLIRRSLSWARPQSEEIRPRYFPPKTKAGRRTISIPALLVAELKRWKLQCPISEDGLVFPREDGKPMAHAKMLETQFYPALSRAKLRRVTFHTLRHSCASAMIASGAPITEVQHRLGHANPAITLLVYSHFLKHAESDVADRLADALLNFPSTTRTRKEVESESNAIAS